LDKIQFFCYFSVMTPEKKKKTTTVGLWPLAAPKHVRQRGDAGRDAQSGSSSHGSGPGQTCGHQHLRLYRTSQVESIKASSTPLAKKRGLIPQVIVAGSSQAGWGRPP